MLSGAGAVRRSGPGVDAVTVGYKNKQEVDEAIENVNLAFA